MIQKEVEKVIKDISLRYGIPYHVARDVINSQFEKTREALKEGEYNNPDTFKTVHLKYLGKFFASDRKIKKIHDSKQRKNDSQSDQANTGGEEDSE